MSPAVDGSDGSDLHAEGVVAFDESPPAIDEIIQLAEQVGCGLKSARRYRDAVRAAAECVVPTLADLAVAIIRRNGADDYIEVAHTDQAREVAARDIILGPGDALAKITAHRDEKEWWWVPSITSAAFQRLIKRDPAIGPLFEALEIQSLVVVPLRAGGRMHGVLALARTSVGHSFTPTELSVAQVIGRRAALAIEGAEVAEGVRTETARRARLDDTLQKWTRVFQLAGWGAVIVDGDDYRIEAANPAFARMHGCEDPGTLTGRPFSELLPASHASEPGTWSSIAHRDSAYESVHRRANGSTFPTLVNVTRLGDENGPPVYVVTVQDLTPLKRAEERLHRAQRMESVGRLAGGVAHEVNNMMTIILGFADILALKELTSDQERDLKEIRKAATRAGNITRQLLLFSRQQVLQPAPLRLNDVTEEMAPVLRLMLPANVRLEASLTPVGGSVRADRAQLEQVLINLAFNARDAMPDGGTIQLATEFRHLDEAAGLRLIGVPIAPGNYGLLSVIDTGVGMDAPTLGQIFEPFFTTKPMGHGTGLGLATVYGIVKQSGGYIWAESTPGQGTTVTVCLPEIDRPAPAPRVKRSRGVRRRASGTVLVVEDEEGVRELASRVLRTEGYQVLEAPSGTAALQFLGDPGWSIDLVLTDVVVPDVELSRIERHSRERRADMPILYMSGYPHDEIVQRGLIGAADQFLQKPFTSVELVERVRGLIGRALVPAPAAPSGGPDGAA